MSFRDNLSTAADIAEILAFDQRAELIAAQNAQLATLRELRDQTRIQLFQAERQKTLQDTLFALRRSLAVLESSSEQTPQKLAADLILAEQTLRLVPPEVFSSLEWKELSVNVQEQLTSLTQQLCQQHGEAMTTELDELRDAVRANVAEEGRRAMQAKREHEYGVHQIAKERGKTDVILGVIAAALVIGVLVFLVAVLSR